MLTRLRRNERGSVLVILAVGVPTFILLAALVLDFGNWYAHKRSLQNRVDAAAFAAGVAYGFKFPACTQNSTLADEISDVAKQYAGVAPPAYNDNAGGSLNVTVNPDGPNPCQPHPTGDYSSPDDSIWTDVQVKQTVPTLFGSLGVTPAITANARVAVMQLQSATGFRPLAIANPAYITGECVSAIFENTQGGSTEVPLTFQGNGHWGSPPTDVDLTTQDSPVSVRVGDCSGASITYDNMGYVGAYDQGSAASEPKLQDLFFTSLSPACDGLYVSRDATGCSFLVSAEINWGNREPVDVSADINGSVSFTGAGGSWQGTVPASQLFAGAGEPGDGAIRVILTGHYRNLDVNGNPVGQPLPFNFGTGSNGEVQSIMAGNDQHEGPIRDFTLSQVSGHDNQTISETIDLTFDSLTNMATTFVLRARAGGGDRMLNGIVDCVDSQSFAQQIARGCKSTFQIHPQSPCSGAPAAPPDCIHGTGTPSGSATSAYNDLWAPNGNCSNLANQNHWSSYPDIPRGDPRLITVPVTRIEAPFSSSSDHPVISFAAFYVTGWRGMPSGCGNELLPAATPEATADLGGEVWGHFVRFVEPSGVGAPKNSGTPANDRCDPTSTDIAACIATLVQ